MRFLVQATMPVEAGNALIRDPNFSKRLDAVLAALKPEAAYFGVQCGQRTMFLIVDMKETAQLPAIVEPLWLSFQADVKLIPVMDKADMAKATPAIQQAVKQF